jgi:hypothetical protein
MLSQASKLQEQRTDPFHDKQSQITKRKTGDQQGAGQRCKDAANTSGAFYSLGQFLFYWMTLTQSADAPCQCLVFDPIVFFLEKLIFQVFKQIAAQPLHEKTFETKCC